MLSATCAAACTPAPALRGAPGVGLDVSAIDSPQGDVEVPSMGRVNVAVRWPARGAYRAQLIPTSANLLRIRVQDAAGDLLGSAEILRSGDESTIATASLSVPSGTGRTILVQAFRDQVPAPGMEPVAQGSAAGVAVLPSTSTPVHVALAPTYGPVIYESSPNGGPGSVLRVVGGNFQVGVLNVSLSGQAINDFVTLRGDLLEFAVPEDVQDGTVVVDVDGVQATRSFRVIRSLTLPSLTGVASGSTASLQPVARDAGGQVIANPVLLWSVDRTASDSTLVDGAFTPYETGTFIVRAYSGTVEATATVTVP